MHTLTKIKLNEPGNSTFMGLHRKCLVKSAKQAYTASFNRKKPCQINREKDKNSVNQEYPWYFKIFCQSAWKALAVFDNTCIFAHFVKELGMTTLYKELSLRVGRLHISDYLLAIFAITKISAVIIVWVWF